MASSSSSSKVKAVNLDEVRYLHHSMTMRSAAFCHPKAIAAMRRESSKLLREDAPGTLLDHQIEDLCLMKGQEEDGELKGDFFEGPRGGLLCEVAGAGKTIIALLHVQMSKALGPTIVLTTNKLMQDVWEPQILTWLKDSSYVAFTSAQEAHKKLNEQECRSDKRIILLNIDAMVKDAKLWPKIKRLQAAHLFVDEGSFLGTTPKSKESGYRYMVEAMKHTTTLTWVLCALPFRAQKDDNFTEVFLSEAAAYDSITRPSAKYRTDTRRLKQSRGIFARLADVFLGTKSAGPRDTEVAEHSRKFHFVIRHSSTEIERFMPALKWVEHEYSSDEERNKKLRKIVDLAWDDGFKVLVAGLSDPDRAKVGALLHEDDVQYVNLKAEKDVALAAKKFATDSELQVALMADSARVGLDSLKEAQTVVFWSDLHDDFANPDFQSTIIKRVCRLGCKHKVVNVVHFHKEVEPPKKRPRMSKASSLGSS
eukprot:TRINITY_DN33210_c0_g1_i1.p1 TRINITY_DN33210_c0_g1~~TRINITY_DN33210_c0_g1_i1.p1  ORF type:complete len:480 (-),score=80.80 TRINITY_DN33210_c0_g1_i1:149-1588(-)